MSFDINGPSEKPVVIGAQNMQNNGGGGNLGYMQQGRKEDKDKSIFQDQVKDDEFVKEKEPVQPESTNFIVKLINWLTKLLGGGKKDEDKFIPKS